MKRIMFVLTIAAACGGDSNEPPPIVQPAEEGDTTGAETPAEPVASGVNEGDAVNIAIQVAESQGYDLELYQDVTVHEGEDGRWLVQLRRPMATRFLQVLVHKVSGDAELSLRSTGH